MLSLNQIISQITTLASAHYQISESGVGDFAEWQAKERNYPILWVFHEQSSINERYLVHDIRLICADRVITGEEGDDTEGHEQEVLSDTQLVLLDFLAYFNNQYGQDYDIIRTATIEPFTERFNDRVAGNSVVIQIRQRWEWNKCSIPESGAVIPPTVDGLTLYDFSDPTVFARLTAQQLTDLESLLCSCDDATVTINGSSLGATGTIPSGGSVDIDVTQDGSPVGSWNGSAWIVPSCPAGGGSISVSLSDNSPNVGDTITITATATGYTPDSYLYFVYDGSGNIVFIAEQSSNTFDWLVSADSLGFTEVYVLGVENGTPDVTAFGTAAITISSLFLLDTPEGTGANFALSFFRLRADYTDPIALIRRASDNAQKEFYFDTNNVLSLSSEDGSGTSLSSWIGGDDGYLVTGYSQDTAGLTYTASAAADQQRIIIGGALVDINGVVAMVGNNDRYTISTSITVKSAFIVAKNDAFNFANYPFAGINNGVLWGGTFAGVDGIAMVDGTNNVKSTVEDLDPHLASILTDTGVYVDGALEASGSINALTITTVGGRPDVATIGMNGKTAVIVSYPTDKTADRAAIEANINSNLTPSLLP